MTGWVQLGWSEVWDRTMQISGARVFWVDGAVTAKVMRYRPEEARKAVMHQGCAVRDEARKVAGGGVFRVS